MTNSNPPQGFPGGARQFTALTDTPNSYIGTAGEFVRVNAVPNGLEFVTPGTIASVIGPLISFLQLSDTPNSYVGTGTNRVTVNVGETGLQFVPDTFLEEQDTPNSYVGTSGNIVRVNAGETGLEFVTPGTIASIIGPLVAFLQLSDTPKSYTGQAGSFVNVNAGETALQFVTSGALAGSIQSSLIPEITNKGRMWISHGDNVITLRKAQLDNNFRIEATIFLPQGAMGGVSGRITYRGTYHAGSARANSMAIVTMPESVNTVKIRLEGGFGYASGGFTGAESAVVDRFDDVANTQTATTALGTAMHEGAGFSLNGYSFMAGGLIALAGTGLAHRLDDSVTATQTERATIFARGGCAGFSLNGFGFVCGGTVTSGTTSPNNIVERFDDIINSWVGRSGLITSRWELAAYSFNNFGFTSGGNTSITTIGGAPVATGITEKFDDVANSWSFRAILTTARLRVGGYSMNAFGFTEQGYSSSAAANTMTAERFNDVANIQESRTGPATAIRSRAGYALNGFGFASGGFIAANSALVDRRDDLVSTFTARTVLTVARESPTGSATNEYFVNYNTENVSEFDEIWNLGTAWIAHGDNVITLPNRHNNLDFRSEVVLQLPIGNSAGVSMITYRGPAHSRPMTVTGRPDDPYVGFGFTSGGFVAAVSAVTERYDDPTQVTTVRDILNVARQGLAGYSFSGFGFTSGGTTGAVTGATDRLDDAANIQTIRTSVTARRHLASFVVNEGNNIPLNSLGHTICGFIAVVTTDTHEEFDDIANLQTARSVAGLSTRDKLAAFSVNQFGFGIGGTITDVVGGITNVNERYDLIADIWSSRAVLPANRMELGGFAFGGFGYVSGGTLDAITMLATTDRYDNVTDAWTNVGNMNTARDQLADWAIDGFGFAACGNTGTDAVPANSAVLNRYDPSTTGWTARTPAPAFTARRDLSGYANPTSNNSNGARLLVRLHGGFGFTTGGFANVGGFVGTTERYDDIANTQLIRTALTSPLGRGLAAWSANGLGFAAFGENPPGANIDSNDRYDDILNTHTGRATAGATRRRDVTGYSLNGFGITTCGFIAVQVGTTERYDDTINTWTARTSATARNGVAGYSLNGFGFSSGGFNGAIVLGTTERFDDPGNFHVTRISITARQFSAGYSLKGYGFVSCGLIVVSTDIVERLDDIADVQLSRASDTVARYTLAGYSLNGFGFTSGGLIGGDTGATDRLDDVANIHTGVTVLNTPRDLLAGYSTNEYFVNYSTMD